MSAPDPYGTLSPERAKHLRRRHRWVGLAVVLLLGAGIVAVRGLEIEVSSKVETRAGAQALKAAVAGDRAQFLVAERHFLKAARAMVFDAYPMFCLELTRSLAAGRLAVARRDLEPAATALAEGDLPRARKALDRATRKAKGR